MSATSLTMAAILAFYVVGAYSSSADHKLISIEDLNHLFQVIEKEQHTPVQHQILDPGAYLVPSVGKKFWRQTYSSATTGKIDFDESWTTEVSHVGNLNGAVNVVASKWGEEQPVYLGLRSENLVEIDGAANGALGEWEPVLSLPMHGAKFTRYDRGNHFEERKIWWYLGQVSVSEELQYSDVFALLTWGAVSRKINLYARGLGRVYTLAAKAGTMGDLIKLDRVVLYKTEPLSSCDLLK